MGSRAKNIRAMGAASLVRGIGVIGVAIALLAVLWSRSPDIAPRSRQTFVTTATQTATIVLSDGTHATLGPSTVLRVARSSTRARTIVIDGEAYLDVPSSSVTPVVVRAGDVDVRVLGTGFLVRYRAGDAGVHVAVANGKVSVTRTNGTFAPRVLAAGEIGDVIDSTVHVTTIGEMSTDMHVENGNVVFRQAPLGEVLGVLTRWYGYQFRCADSSLARQKVTVVVSPQSSVIALSALRQLFDVAMSPRGDTVTLSMPSAPHAGESVRMRSHDPLIPHTEVGR